MEEAAALVSDADVALASLALRFLMSLMRAPAPGGSAAAAVVGDKARRPALVLVCSPLLQGGGLEVLQGFFATLAATGREGGEDELLGALLEAGKSAEAASKQVEAGGKGEVLFSDYGAVRHCCPIASSTRIRTL